MKIAIISDIHDNAHNLILALKQIEKDKIETIICLGDLINPGNIKIMGNSGIKTIFCILGNNDGDVTNIMKNASKAKNKFILINKTHEVIKLKNKKIFISHYPDMVEIIANSGKVDIVLYGHTHKIDYRTVEDCIIINPGEICGIRYKKATYATLDLETNDIQFIELENPQIFRTDEYEQYLREKNIIMIN